MRFLAVLFGLLLITGSAQAASTINTAQPVQGAPYNASPVRLNFGAAANDINALQTLNAGASAPSNPSLGYLWVQTGSASKLYPLSVWDGVKWLPIGTVDAATHLWTPPVGGGAAGSLLSAATTDLGSVAASSVTVTGNNPIFSFGASAPPGTIKFVTFSGSPTLNYNATSLLLPTKANILVSAGDTVIAQALGAGSWNVLVYQPVSGFPINIFTAGQVQNTTALRNACTSTIGCPLGDFVFPNGVIRWTDGVAGAPPLPYSKDTAGVCSADDGGHCVAAAGGGYWLAQFSGPADVREWGAKLEGTPGYSGSPPVDPAGTFDSTAALNAACATGLPLIAPPGRFHVTNMISCASQIIGGAGGTTEQSVIDVGSDFNMSAAGVLNVAPSAASNQMGAHPKNIDIAFYQNAAAFPTITANISGTTLTVVSGSLSVGSGVSAGVLPPGDYIASGSSPTYTLAAASPGPGGTNITVNVFPTIVGSISGTTLTVSSGTPAVGNILAGLGIPNGIYIVSGGGSSWVVSQSLTVGSETISYYSLIMYPPAIIATTPPARPILENVTVQRAWNGIEFPGNYAPIFEGITQIGAFNVPLLLDGALDYTFIHSMEIWPFGNAAAPSLTGIWYMNPPNVEIGYVDGLEVANMALFAANMTFLADATYVTGYQFGNLHFNGTAGGIFLNNGGVFVSNLSLDMSQTGISVDGPYDSTFLHVGICKCITSAPANYMVNHQGRLEIDGGVLSEGSSATGPLIAIDTAGGSSTTIIRGLDIHLPGTLTTNLIAQTGNAVLVLDDLTTVKGGTDSAPLVSVGTDIGGNSLTNLNFRNWGSSTVSVSINPSGVAGFYDLPNVVFPITSTPTFTTEGDFSPVGNTVTGWYKLLGDHVAFQLEDTFGTNAYTTATGGFFLATDLPYGVAGSGSVNNIIPTFMSNVTIGSNFFPGGMQIAYNNPINLYPILVHNSASWSQMGPTNIPASTSGILFQMAGTYYIR